MSMYTVREYLMREDQELHMILEEYGLQKYTLMHITSRHMVVCHMAKKVGILLSVI